MADQRADPGSQTEVLSGCGRRLCDRTKGGRSGCIGQRTEGTDLSTYVISDIHGALPQFQKLLKKIKFSPEKGDELYLLGDYIDWGAYPLETLLFVMHLDRSSDHVHCIRGNHEEMFLAMMELGQRAEAGSRQSYCAELAGEQPRRGDLGGVQAARQAQAVGDPPLDRGPALQFRCDGRREALYAGSRLSLLL